MCIGHYAVGGLEPPGAKRGATTQLPHVLEVSDTGVGTLSVGGSEHLQAVVDQLLPPPLRYRLVWHAKGSGASSAGGDEKRASLYLWRAVPPGPQFCALGVLATATEEPPPISAVHCVPRRWCALEKPKPKPKPKPNLNPDPDPNPNPNPNPNFNPNPNPNQVRPREGTTAPGVEERGAGRHSRLHLDQRLTAADDDGRAGPRAPRAGAVLPHAGRAMVRQP